MTSKRYITANELLHDAFSLGACVLEDKFFPDLVIGIARGGEPIAIAVHEVAICAGLSPSYEVIRATSYTGIDEQGAVRFDISESLGKLIHESNKVLLVDDVFDTGRTLAAILGELQQTCPETTLRTATVWYKPLRNLTELKPDYSLHETDDWLVFPHELCGLEPEELKMQKAGLPDNLPSLLRSLKA